MAAIFGHGTRPWLSLPDINGIIGSCVALALIAAVYRLVASSRTTAIVQPKNVESSLGQKPPLGQEATAPSMEPLNDFDWRSTEPTRYLPVKPVYHITMALQQDTPSNLITIDKDYLDRVTLRRRLIDEKGPAVHGHLPRGKESVAELYTYLLHDHLPARYPTMFKLSSDGSTFENTVTTKTLPVQAPEDANAALRSLGETVEEDIFLLHETTDGHLCVAFVCCFPSGFDPSVKFGSLLKDIHGPVPSYSKIGPSMERFFSKLKVGESVKRLNVRPNSLLMLHVDMTSACVNADGVFARGQWSVQTHGRLYTLGNHITDDELEVASDNKIDVDQVLLHTHLMLIPTDSEVQTYFRVELQTLTRLPRTQAVMFSFKTYLYSIRQIKEEGSGPELADAIEGLKSGNAPGMWRYKSAVRWGPAVCNYLRSGV